MREVETIDEGGIWRGRGNGVWQGGGWKIVVLFYFSVSQKKKRVLDNEPKPLVLSHL